MSLPTEHFMAFCCSFVTFGDFRSLEKLVALGLFRPWMKNVRSFSVFGTKYPPPIQPHAFFPPIHSRAKQYCKIHMNIQQVPIP